MCHPVWSEIILMIKQIRLLLSGCLILLITCMITHRIELHSVLLPLLIYIYHSNRGRDKLQYLVNVCSLEFLFYIKANPVSQRTINKVKTHPKNYSPGQKVWNTLSFRWGKCNSSWPLSPLGQCWVLQVKHLSHYPAHVKDLNFVLCSGGGWGVENNLVKAVFMSVYHRLAANSIQKHVKKVRCPKTFLPGL